MKSFLAFTLLITTACGFAQTTSGPDEKEETTLNKQSDNNNQLNSLAAGGGANTAPVTGMAVFYNPKFDREGSVYLFEQWGQSASIFVKGGNGSFKESNINFNIQRSMFEAKVAEDSIVSFNFASIEKIVVGGRTFKSFFLEEIQRNKAFEIVYQGEDFTLLKGYEIDLLEASPNPMIARPRDKYIQRSTYYIETAKTLEEFKLRKKSILAALTSEQAKLAKEYSSKYGKSFTDEADLKMILNYATR